MCDTVMPNYLQGFSSERELASQQAVVGTIVGPHACADWVECDSHVTHALAF
jgi:hypothetical protein